MSDTSTLPDDNRAKRNVAVLVLAQAILGAQMPMIFVVGGLAGPAIAFPDDAPPRKKRGDFDFGTPPAGGNTGTPGRPTRPRTPADASAAAIAA